MAAVPSAPNIIFPATETLPADPPPPVPTSIGVKWDIPVTRVDGVVLPVSEIAKYTIHIGVASRVYATQIDINDATLVNFTISSLASAGYYITMTTTDTGGRTSAFSNEVFKMLD